MMHGLNNSWPKVMSELLPAPFRKFVWINNRYSNEECAYVIAADKNTHVVTVVFRGSDTIKDWMANFDAGMTHRPNPIKEDYQGKTDTIGLRIGYWKYLMQPRSDNGRSKYDEIADKAYEYGQELGDDFTLQVTGHSLGGALGLLFGFYASTNPRFNKTEKVRVTTFGSSTVGNMDCARAFQQQERFGKLGHARFVMRKDIVPSVQFLKRRYAHTGHRIELSEQDDSDEPKLEYVHDVSVYGTFKMLIVTGATTKFIRFPDLLNPLNAYKNHSTHTYWKAIVEKRERG